MKRAFPAALTALVFSSCAVGPDFHRPAAPADAGYTAAPLPAATAGSPVRQGEAQHLIVGGDIPAQWWELFHSPALNALIAEALRRNNDLKAARAGLKVALENLAAQKGAFWPAVTGSAGYSRNRNAVEVSPYLASNQLLYNLAQAQLNASWTLDVFGANRRSVEALRALADAQRFQLEATCLSLTSNLVAAAIQEASLRAQIAATRELVHAAEDTLEIMKRQRSLGALSDADVAAQDVALAQVQQALPPLEKQLAQERDLISALTGRLPSQPPAQTFELDQLQLPGEVPLSLPSRLIEQRPDIRIAEANMHAASAQVGVAIANLLPTFTLSANPGYLATSASQLFEPANVFWSIGAGVTQPIFEGGALLHKTKAARAALEQATAQYGSAVIDAYQNVADALQALEADARTLQAAAYAERAAARSYDLAKRQLELGAISYLTSLTAQQAYQNARISLIQAEGARLSDTAALFQALGGGWWNRPLAARE